MVNITSLPHYLILRRLNYRHSGRSELHASSLKSKPASIQSSCFFGSKIMSLTIATIKLVGLQRRTPSDIDSVAHAPARKNLRHIPRVCVAFLFGLVIGGCAGPTTVGVDVANLPARLLSINDFNYAGAFALPDGTYGESSANWAEGVIEVNGDSLFFVGHDHDDAIAEFVVPPLVSSRSIADLQYARPPRQAFTKVIERVSGGNREALDQIVGLELVNGRLIGNAIEYYDAPADNQMTTFVVENASTVASAPVTGFYSLKGEVRAAGWLSAVPPEWQQALGCSHITGHSSGGPIISRHSVGPSAFCVNLEPLALGQSKKKVRTKEMLGYRLDRPLERDLFNEDGDNALWTHLSQARFGFIVPGTSTYATFGSSGGHQSGVGYKLARPNGNPCDGYCPADPADHYNYYWLWDMKDLFRAKNNRLPPSAITPYESGVFNVPFQTGNGLNQIGGASYDEQSGRLYISVLRSNNTLGPYSNPPVIVAYQIGR